VKLRRLVGWRPHIGPCELVRALTDEERDRVQARLGELRVGLAPDKRDRAAIISVLAGMLSGFHSMRQHGDAAETMVRVTAHVLREFPLWAIQRVCLKVAQGKAGLDPHWPPSDAEMYAAVQTEVAPYRKDLTNAEVLLAAVPGERV
jgi:hypothetical protein